MAASRIRDFYLGGQARHQLSLKMPPEMELEKATVRARVAYVYGDLVAIDAGLEAGVRRAMRMLVHRGPRYVGSLKIERLDTDRAAGVMVETDTPVQVGDEAVFLPPK